VTAVLLDTHALLWWLVDDPSLPSQAKHVIADTNTTILVSAASAMEITTKYRLGKLPYAGRLATSFISVVAGEGFELLSISVPHAVFAGNLEISHKDPFDRLLIAQSILDSVSLVGNERLFDGFGVSRIWT
jgi:PIN domain nuclease of toxin-antitoxin system